MFKSTPTYALETVYTKAAARTNDLICAIFPEVNDKMAEITRIESSIFISSITYL